MQDEKRKEYIELQPHINEMKEDIKTVKKLLLGNGKIGLAAKVQILWAASIFMIVSIFGIIGKWVVGVMKSS